MKISSGQHGATYLGLFIPIFLLLSQMSEAQNLQLHYDYGKNRGYLTSTVEMFKPDKHGSTYFFIDMDYNSVPGSKGISLAYWELARALKFWKSPFAFHTEYNGGFGQWSDGEEKGAFQIENAFLNGIEYSRDAEDFSRGFTLQVLHKFIQGKHNFSFQLTGVWYINFADSKLSFTGFADFWREDFVFEDKITKFCFSAEPQLWYNLNTHFALGGEAETDINFGGQKGFHVYPTVGAKYTF
jgi:hypothetical protein